ncbi:hypothetical protein MRB53_040254 [Persea americana]|nr:hypothetical protein MRB53_040254 [Persea americana]
MQGCKPTLQVCEQSERRTAGKWRSIIAHGRAPQSGDTQLSIGWHWQTRLSISISLPSGYRSVTFRRVTASDTCSTKRQSSVLQSWEGLCPGRASYEHKLRDELAFDGVRDSTRSEAWETTAVLCSAHHSWQDL